MRKKETGGRMRLLWEISRGSRAFYIISFTCMVIVTFCNYLLPLIVRFVVDNVIGGLPVENRMFAAVSNRFGPVASLRGNLVVLGAFVLAVAVVRGFANFFQRRLLSMGAESMIKRLRDRLYSHIQHLPYSWHVKIQTGDIIQRCTSDMEIVRNFVANQLMEMIRTLVLVAIAYSILFPMNFLMALCSFLFLPVVFAYSFVFLTLASKRFLAADEAEGKLLSVAQENFTGVRVVRAFGRERHEVDRFDKENHNFANLWMRLGRLLSVYWGMGDLITGLQMITICVAGVYEAVNGNITVGDFMVFISFNSMTIWPVRNLGRTLSEASKTTVSLGRIREILDAQPEADSHGALSTPIDGDIVFENVSFSYGNSPVLDDVSFTVERGTTLGILGGTGSGKTTVAHLLCRLYDPDKGSISIGGMDISRYKRDWLRQNIGIVLQEPFLFSRTIGENIAALSSVHSADEIREAARVSCVDEAIEQFALGYDTIVGERGVTLSGGQKQRVAIARTILKNPPVLIFDDSLSAVDTETDSKIRAALGARTSGVTTIIISHRITSLSKADKIIVMENGRILEMGTHYGLLSLGGVYRKIHDMQESISD